MPAAPRSSPQASRDAASVWYIFISMEPGCQSEVGSIRRVLLKHVRDALVDDHEASREAESLGYLGIPDLSLAVAEYDRFVALLNQFDIEIDYLPRDDRTTLDSVYVHDPVVITDRGAIVCNMGKEARRSEPAIVGEFLRSRGVPLLGSITGDGLLEGGDLVWLGQRTVAVGAGYRTNAEGIGQLRSLLGDLVDELITVPLPHWNGPGDVLHLMSLISPIDRDLQLVYSPLLPVPFRQWLLSRGMKLVEVSDEEFASMACNVLAVAPRKCFMLEGNPKTRRLLEAEDVEVWTFEGNEISLKGQGGPTCLTRAIVRAPC